MNIYELHAGSWKQKEDGSWYNYEELAEELIPYLKKMGFNYIEFLPISEYWIFRTDGPLWNATAVEKTGRTLS